MVDVLVQVFDRGELKRVVVPVEEQCFEPGHVCWKAIANIRAAVILELPFTTLERCAKHGLKPEDRERLREMYGGKTEGGRQGAVPTEDGGPMWSYIRDSASSAPTEREEASA